MDGGTQSNRALAGAGVLKQNAPTAGVSCRNSFLAGVGVSPRDACPAVLVIAVALLAPACVSGSSRGPSVHYADKVQAPADSSPGRPWDPGDGARRSDVGPPPGFDGGPRFGEACEGHDDCPEGFCVQVDEGRLCTARCVQTCPDGWTCAGVDLFGGSDLTSICMPKQAPACDGCDSPDAGGDPGEPGDPGATSDPGPAPDGAGDRGADSREHPACGNDECEARLGEDLESCPLDCAACGDGTCSPAEGPIECPVDCCGGGEGGAGCGDGLCVGYACGEDPATCPVDCGTACGDGVCERGESPEVCVPDCKRFVFGIGVCEPTDGGPETCPEDCGAACGDCACEPGEDFVSCPIDCGFCGDGVCTMCAHVAEDPERCPADCAGAPVGETCNDRDDDGDGRTDEGFPGLGRACTTEFGTGETVCDEAGDGTYCRASAPPPEVCDGKDDDGDGQTDEGTCNDGVRCTTDRCLGQEGCAHDLVPACETGLGSSEVVLLPERIDFGPVLSGCVGYEQSVRVYNLSAHAIQVETVEIDPACAEPFVVAASPSLPATVLSGTNAEIRVGFRPGDSGPHSCALQVTTNAFSAPLFAPLWGTTSPSAQQMHTFVRPERDRADVVLVVDDSGSMEQPQQRLAAAVSSFIAKAAPSIDYRLGVVSTDVVTRPGELRGEPRWLSSSSEGVEQAVAAAVQLGTAGSAEAESGLHALYLTLTPPNNVLAVTGGGDPVACQGEADCPSPHGCNSYPDASDGGASYCGGPNSGFLREDARLEAVFISDEDDQSPFEVGFYLDAMRRLKGGRAGAFRAHALIGPLPDGCDAANLYGAPGYRYAEIADATYGAVGSICSASYDGVMEIMGATALARTHVFELSRPGVVSSVSVQADGTPCDDGWTYEEGDHAVHLAPGGPCDQAFGSTLTVRYRVACP